VSGKGAVAGDQRIAGAELFLLREHLPGGGSQAASSPTPATPKITVPEVMDQAGFNSKSSSNTAFKKIALTTPGDYMKKVRGLGNRWSLCPPPSTRNALS
jgi:AraC-like DNA-binding protein